MPEYLSPGVYVEEVSFRSKSIEGVPTSTTGFAGLARFGPVHYAEGPITTEPRLITSFTEFEQVYGGLDTLQLQSISTPRLPFLAHAARAFFDNGGKRLYVSRVFIARDEVTDKGVASTAVALNGGGVATWRARWPGEMGNVLVQTRVVRSKKAVFAHAVFGQQVRGVGAGAVLEITAGGGTPLTDDKPLNIANLRLVQADLDGKQTYLDSSNTSVPVISTDQVQQVEMQVLVSVDPDRTDAYDQLAADPQQKRYIGHILQKDHPEDENAVVWLEWSAANPPDALRLITALRGTADPGQGVRLDKGNDGALPIVDDFAGKDADVDDPTRKATGLAALGEIDDIAIVALPDGGAMPDADQCAGAAGKVISHCEAYRYRIGIIDAPENCSMTDIRN